MRQYNISTDFIQVRAIEPVVYKQYDNGNNLEIEFFEDGEQILLTDETVLAFFQLADNTVIQKTCSINNGNAIATLDNNILSLSGQIKVEFTIYKDGDETTTRTLLITVESSINRNEAITTTPQWDIVNQILNIQPVEETRVQAENSRIAAEEQRQNNETARVLAENSRISAEQARETNTSTALNNANTATDNANTATTNANTQADYAKAQGDYAKSEADRVAGMDVTVLTTNMGSPANLQTTDKSSLVNAINENVAHLAEIATNPKNFGAIGDGANDDSQRLVSANTLCPNLLIPNGTFRISQNITLGNVSFANGGEISIDSGITVTVDSIACVPSNVCIKGQGTLIIKNNWFSLGWYEGNSANAKWDFMRRGFSQGVQKYVYVPLPKASDPACTSALEFPYSWAVNGALNFNDPEDMLIFDSIAPFVAVAGCTDMFVFSTIAKTEEITFPKGLWVEGGNTRTAPIANNGIVIHGGARIKFMGATRCKTFLQYGVVIDDSTFGNDEIQFDFLECTGFGLNGFYSKGNANGNSYTKIGMFFSNGALSGAESFIKLSGKLRDVSIDKFVENIVTSSGYSDVSTAGIIIESTSDGASQGIILHDSYMTVSYKPVILTRNNGGSTKMNQITVKDVWSNNATILLNLSYLMNARISSIQSLANGIVVNSDCSNLDIMTDTPNVSGNCPMLKINGRFYAKYVMNNQTAISLTFPTGAGTGKAEVMAVEDSTNQASVFLRNSGAIISAFAATNVNMTTGALSGTTGTVGKLNLSFTGGVFYIENQMGASRTIIVFVSL
jgi:hypothetical protein